jgi:hypothetical protein
MWNKTLFFLPRHQPTRQKQETARCRGVATTGLLEGTVDA